MWLSPLADYFPEDRLQPLGNRRRCTTLHGLRDKVSIDLPKARNTRPDRYILLSASWKIVRNEVVRFVMSPVKEMGSTRIVYDSLRRSLPMRYDGS